MRHRAHALLTAAVALTAAAAQPALAAMAEKTVEQSIPTGGTIKIANLAGTIDLIPAGPGPVHVVAQVKAEGSNPGETRDLMTAMHWVQEPDGTWNLAYPVQHYDAFVYPEGLRKVGGSNSGKFRGERVRVYGSARYGTPVLFADLSIAIPKGATVVVKNVVGSVHGRSLDGDLTVDTGSGGVTLDGAAGKLYVDTGSGDVKLKGIAGNTKVDTGSGDVTIDDISAEVLKIDTGSGDVTLHGGTLRDVSGDTGSGDIELKEVSLQTFHGDTGSGDVMVEGDLSQATKIDVDTGSGEVSLYGGPNFEFDLTTDVSSGDVEVRYDDVTLRKDGHDIVGAKRGSGQTRVMVDTGSGDVTLAPSRL